MQPEKKTGNYQTGSGAERTDRPIPSKVYPEIDTDLARDNLENDLSAADLQDL